jgi:hypothetical protein
MIGSACDDVLSGAVSEEFYSMPMDADQTEEDHAGLNGDVDYRRAVTRCCRWSASAEHRQPAGAANLLPCAGARFEAWPSFSRCIRSPARSSRLRAAAPDTRMPITVLDGPQNLQANRVYVIPSGKAPHADNGQMSAVDAKASRNRHVTVDLFFRTLADSHGRTRPPWCCRAPTATARSASSASRSAAG